MNTLTDLDGVYAARATAYSATSENEATASLTISAASGFNEGRYFPAESVTIDSIEALRRLQVLLEEVLAHAEGV